MFNSIEQKVWSLLEQAIACFKLSMDGYIRTGRHYFWLMQDRVCNCCMNPIKPLLTMTC